MFCVQCILMWLTRMSVYALCDVFCHERFLHCILESARHEAYARFGVHNLLLDAFPFLTFLSRRRSRKHYFGCTQNFHISQTQHCNM